ncbi:hypothetical protein RFI_05029, partial [Reticulomyxa filosa]
KEEEEYPSISLPSLVTKAVAETPSKTQNGTCVAKKSVTTEQHEDHKKEDIVRVPKSNANGSPTKLNGFSCASYTLLYCLYSDTTTKDKKYISISIFLSLWVSTIVQGTNQNGVIAKTKQANGSVVTKTNESPKPKQQSYSPNSSPNRQNSTLQCLAHTSLLRRYFLQDSKWCSHLNRRNPIGYEGQIALHFAKLLCLTVKRAVISPGELIHRFTGSLRSFSNGRQHDAQEFLTNFLDG